MSKVDKKLVQNQKSWEISSRTNAYHPKEWPWGTEAPHVPGKGRRVLYSPSSSQQTLNQGGFMRARAKSPKEHDHPERNSRMWAWKGWDKIKKVSCFSKGNSRHREQRQEHRMNFSGKERKNSKVNKSRFQKVSKRDEKAWIGHRETSRTVKRLMFMQPLK